MALTDGGTRHLHVGVGRLLVGVDGVGEDADEGGGDEEEPAELPVEAAAVADHEVDVADEASHPCWAWTCNLSHLLITGLKVTLLPYIQLMASTSKMVNMKMMNPPP